MEAEKRSSAIQSIERAAALMRCFSEASPELGVTELSERLRLHKSTVARFLATLQKEGFVSQNPTTHKYRLGVGLISLAGVALGRVDVRHAAYYHIDELVEQTQESASVSILDGSECVNVLNKPSPRPVRYVNWIGRRLPLHCTASGKVLLAWLSPAERVALLPRVLQRHTPSTISSFDQLHQALDDVCAAGFATALEEYEEGFCAIAAPIRGHDGQARGALAVSGPAFRLSQDTLHEFADVLLITAGRISAEMGFVAADSIARGGRLV